MKTLLIDADIMIFKTLYKVETEIDWGDDIWSRFVDLSVAKREVHYHLSGLQEKLGADAIVLTLSDRRGKYFRHELEPSYKASRTDKPKPMCYGALRDHISRLYLTHWFPRLEGDDVMGLLSGEPTLGETMIVSDDKDMLTVPGWHYTSEIGEFLVSPKEADRNFFKQTLCGDRADGFPGAPGIGPKTAEKILDEDCSWDRVRLTFRKAGCTEEFALQQARLARILRPGEYDRETGEVALWEPAEGMVYK